METERWDTLMARQAEAAGQDAATYVRERSQEFPLGRIALPQDRNHHHGGRRHRSRGVSLSKFLMRSRHTQ